MPPCVSALFTELTFTWIFNEYPSFVTQDTRRFVSQKTGNLYIAKVEPSDVGNYTCVVTNTVTRTSVQGPPTPLVLRVDGTSAIPLLHIHGGRSRGLWRQHICTAYGVTLIRYTLAS